MIKELSPKHSVEKMAEIYDVSRSGYYDWLHRKPSASEIKRNMVLEALEAAHKATLSYGIDNLWEEVKEKIPCGRNMIYRLMKKHKIYALRANSFKITTNSDHDLTTYPNILSQNFKAEYPNQKWVTDITYIPTEEGWAFAAIVKDLFTKDIVGWATGDRITKDLAIRALNNAIKVEKPKSGLIHHSDRGVQYCSKAYQEILKDHGFVVSMSRPGTPYDNACAENFFSCMKNEKLSMMQFKTSEDAYFAVFEYIELFYRRKRRHSGIGRISPLEFKKQYFKNMAA